MKEDLIDKVENLLFEVDKNYPPSVHTLSKQIIDLVRGSEWISVETELPDFDNEVLVFIASGYRFVATLQNITRHIGQDSPKDKRWYARPSWGHELKVTHWQPLPSPPTNKGESNGRTNN